MQEELSNTAKGELPALTLLTDLTDIFCRRAFPHLDVNLLLNIDIVCHLIILVLADTILLQILPWKNMMDIPPVFNHLLDTDVSRQETLVIEFCLRRPKNMKRGRTTTCGCQALNQTGIPE